MKNIKRVAVLTLLALPACLSAASTAQSLRVHIPFAFVIAGKQFRPGDYVVQADNNGIVSVQGGGRGALTLSLPASATNTAATPALIFSKREKTEYLVGVQSDFNRNSRIK